MSSSAAYGIITPEAVVLELAPAGLATRAFAKLIDLLCQGLILGVLAMLIGYLAGFMGGSLPTVLLSVSVFVVLFVLPIVTEAIWNGKSPGKAVVGLRVVTADGGPIQFRHAAVRGLLQPLDIYAGIGALPALFTRRSQRLGDLLAGTFVLSDRVASARAHAILFVPPPGCEELIARMDVGRLTHRQYSTIRQFLLRVGELSPDARGSLALRLATPVRELTSASPPGWMTAELFLICVASAYQLRSGTLPPEAVMSRQMPGGPPGGWWGTGGPGGPLPPDPEYTGGYSPLHGISYGPPAIR